MKIKTIEEVLPILGFNGNVLVSNNLNLTIGLKLHLPEVLSCSGEKIEQLHDTFRRVVNLYQGKRLPELNIPPDLSNGSLP